MDATLLRTEVLKNHLQLQDYYIIFLYFCKNIKKTVTIEHLIYFCHKALNHKIQPNYFLFYKFFLVKFGDLVFLWHIFTAY